MKRFTWILALTACAIAAPAAAKGSWTATQVGTTSWRAVDCPKASLCIAVGDSAMSLRMEADGGGNLGIMDGNGGSLVGISFADSIRGYVASAWGGRVYRTLDGGATWVGASAATYLQDWSAIHAAGEHVFVVGRLTSCYSGNTVSGCNYFAAASKMATFGDPWPQLEYLPGTRASAVYFIDSVTGYVVEGSTVHKTTVGGAKNSGFAAWSGKTLEGPINALHFVGSNPGYAVGDSGRIYKTTDSGANWKPQASGTTRRLRDVHFVTAEAGYAVGDSGTILETENGGATWTYVPEMTTVNLNAVTLTRDGGGYAVGDQGVVMRLTGGPTSLARAMPRVGAGTRVLRRQGLLLRRPDGRAFNILGRSR